ncbi:hypothetical protein SKAU_G00008870 [Synaphobranchus kaupii]|uniref:Uncharacterized protein n=1 Tax=Synaphobranchus kaupii TaxID=118154 RepID=A0A9Q1GAT7_SYNKA|nr:hypothetical protein SKAU_G00008870 [Synaphobranchus kaupii]
MGKEQGVLGLWKERGIDQRRRSPPSAIWHGSMPWQLSPEQITACLSPPCTYPGQESRSCARGCVSNGELTLSFQGVRQRERAAGRTNKQRKGFSPAARLLQQRRHN